MSLSRLWVWLAVLLPVLAALIAGLSAVDLAYHLRAGSAILDGHGIPAIDTWTFTAAGTPWLDQQWGAQAFLAIVERLGGWSLLFVFRAMLVALCFGLVFFAARMRGASTRMAAWLAIGAFLVAAVALALRPQLIAMVFFAGTLALLAARRRWPRTVWVIPILVLIWANVHGSFVLGPIALGLAWLEDRADGVSHADRLLVVAAIATAATLVTPFGLDTWRYAVGLSTNAEVSRRITEWQPTTLRDAPGLLFFASVAVVVVVLARIPRSVPWVSLLWLVPFVFIGAYAVRGVAWWPMVAAYAIAPYVGRRAAVDPDRRSRPAPRLAARLNVAIVTALGLAVIALLPWWRPTDSALGAPAGVVADAPSGITAELETVLRPGDRILNAQPWGSWLEWAFPAATVAVDSRIEVIPAAVWRDFERVSAGLAGWQDIVMQWAPTVAVIGPNDTDLEARLSGLGWTTVFTDRDGRVMIAPERRS